MRGKTERGTERDVVRPNKMQVRMFTQFIFFSIEEANRIQSKF